MDQPGITTTNLVDSLIVSTFGASSFSSSLWSFISGESSGWPRGEVIAYEHGIATAFTGYLIQTNFDSQWISFEAKDGFNSVGIGAFFNVTNLGQMLLLHVALLPFVLGILTVIHVLAVRRRGVVPPIDADEKA